MYALTKICSASAMAVCRENHFFPLFTSLLCNKKTKKFSTKQLSPEEAKKANWQGRVDLAAALRGFEMMNFHEGIWNHLSFVVPAANGDGEVMLINNYGYHWSEAKPELMIGLNEQGDIVEGAGDVETSAKTVHLSIHKARPDAKCAAHIHTPYAIALGMLKDLPFGMYHQNSLIFYNDFAYDENFNGLIFDLDEGQRIVKHLEKDKSVLFMCNHGVIVVAKTVAQMFHLAYYLERACMFQVLAMSTGRELREIPEDICKETKRLSDKYLSRYSDPFLESIKRITGLKMEYN